MARKLDINMSLRCSCVFPSPAGKVHPDVCKLRLAMAVATQPLKPKNSAKKSVPSVPAAEVIAELEKHILVDGFKLVFDVEKSRGSRFVDAATGRELIDLYSFYASQPVGFNHPYFERPEVREDLLRAAKVKVACADVYTTQYATSFRRSRA